MADGCFSKPEVEVVMSHAWIQMSINVDLQKFNESDIMKYKPEIVWSCRGRHYVIVYDVMTPPQVVRFGRNLAT